MSNMELKIYDILVGSDESYIQECAIGDWVKLSDIKEFFGIDKVCDHCKLLSVVRVNALEKYHCAKYGYVDGFVPKRHPDCIKTFGE